MDSMTKIKAVLFDMDGTLVNSEGFHYKCWTEVLEPFGVILGYAYYNDHFTGTPTPVNAKAIIELHELSIALDDLMKRRDAIVHTKMEQADIEMMPFALETILFFRNLGLPLAIVTGSPRFELDTILRKKDLQQYLDFTVSRSDVQRSKPDGESYEKAVDYFGFSKEEYLVFEDTENGVKSAKAAGLTCYAIQHLVDEHPKLKLADKIFSDLRAAKDSLVDDGVFSL